MSVPADYGDAVVRAITEAGAEFTITPYGIEALSTMRIEKGHVAGAELNGTTTATDLCLRSMMSRNKDYIGRVLAQRDGLVSSDREVLTGIRPCDPNVRIHGGAHILGRNDGPGLANNQGYVSSAAFSPTLATWIGLALVKNGASRHGEIVRVYDRIRGGTAYATLCSPVHLDPQNARLHA